MIGAYASTFLQGMIAMACLIVAVFFLRYWRKTRDRLFLIFAIAFCLMCGTRILTAALSTNQSTSSPASAKQSVHGREPPPTASAMHQAAHSGYVYTFRFVAYVLILAAIIDKNRPR